ncbi:MAG: hypothetical protein JWM69_1162 [Candidatus Binatus sp.]|nr:hypothetical protein [Candidatus Binatus sp.]
MVRCRAKGKGEEFLNSRSQRYLAIAALWILGALAIPTVICSQPSPSGAPLNAGPSVSTPTTPGASPIPAVASPSPQVYYVPIPAERLSELHDSIIYDEAWLKGVAIAASVLLLATPIIAKFYVQDLAAKATITLRGELERDFQSAIAAAQNALTVATSQVTEIGNALSAQVAAQRLDIDVKLESESASTEYSLAFLFWSLKDPDRAIEHVERAIRSTRKHLEALAAQNSPPSSASLNARQIAAKKFLCFELGDLAYYRAALYSRTKLAADGLAALKDVRVVLKEWLVFGDVPPIELVDNYLFIVATVELATEQEREIGRALYQDHREELIANLSQQTGQVKIDEFAKIEVYRKAFEKQAKATKPET